MTLRAGLAAALLLAALRSLAQPPAVATRAEACFVCHGKDGHSQQASTPSLGAQPAFFVVAQLFLFRDGRRGAAPQAMYDAAKGLTDDDLRAFGDYLAKLPPPPPPAGKPDPVLVERGRALAQGHNCGVCHNPDYSGREQMPRLANQREDYLLKALRDYKQGVRVGYGSATMPETVATLSDADLVALSHYLAQLPRRGR